MIVSVPVRLWDLLKLVLPKSFFVTLYMPSTEAQRKQSEVERNAIRSLIYKAKKIPGVDFWLIP